jgi:hypothetical protein
MKKSVRTLEQPIQMQDQRENDEAQEFNFVITRVPQAGACANSGTIERDDGALRKLLEQLESARDENYSMRKEIERSNTS